MITANDFASSYGPLLQGRALRKTLPRYEVFSKGMSPSSLNAGDFTVSLIASCGGSVCAMASSAAPVSPAEPPGVCCAMAPRCGGERKRGR